MLLNIRGLYDELSNPTVHTWTKPNFVISTGRETIQLQIIESYVYVEDNHSTHDRSLVGHAY